MYGLPYWEVWALDFEFVSESGALPVPVCMVARELRTGRLIRLWQDEFPDAPPFPVDGSALFVAYLASAEIGCFLALGWPVPVRVLDLYVEFRNETNGRPPAGGRSLLGALSYHGIASISKTEKHEMRDLVLRGGPWSTDERREILDYCQSDVDVLAPLLKRMLPHITSVPRGLGQSLLRGRYMTAVARMERTGIPVDVEKLAALRDRWSDIKLDLIKAVDVDYGVFEGGTFKAELFAAWLAERGIDWPRTETGRLRLDQDTFKDYARTYPELAPLKELRHALGEMRLESIAVGPDDRNRTLLSPFGASSGRNTPSNTQFLFGPAVWLRGLIKPKEDRALAYIDWSSQEVAIAAKLSEDTALQEAIATGDPYLAFAKMAGLAPPDATKASHKQVRDACKTCVLGANYGMQAASLARRIGIHVIEAQGLLRRMAQTFPTYTEWAEQVIDIGRLGGSLTTVFGWRLHVTSAARSTTLRNFPMQANGAEMLRLACSLATERGIDVCAPVHDALLVEGPADDMDRVVTETRQAMAEASRVVLDGVEIKTDVDLIRWPDRYADPRGQRMWERVDALL